MGWKNILIKISSKFLRISQSPNLRLKDEFSQDVHRKEEIGEEDESESSGSSMGSNEDRKYSEVQLKKTSLEENQDRTLNTMLSGTFIYILFNIVFSMSFRL